MDKIDQRIEITRIARNGKQRFITEKLPDKNRSVPIMTVVYRVIYYIVSSSCYKCHSNHLIERYLELRSLDRPSS